jgi:predicted permease
VNVGAWVNRLLRRVLATFSAGHDRQLRDELQLHLHLLEEEYVAQGISPDVARQRARREFGNATRIQEASREMFSFRLLEDFIRDLQYAFREMRRRVAFTCISVASLAVGIGAITASFAVIDAFMLRGLPVREPERLVGFSTTDSRAWGAWPYAAFTRWRHSPDRLFEVAAASEVIPHDVPLRGSDKPGEVRVSLVSANYFHVMGVNIALGRGLAEQDEAVASPAAVAVISEAFWVRWFGRTPDVLQRTIELRGASYHVVGVVQRGFAGHVVGHPADVWVPLTAESALMPGARLLEDRWGTGARWLRIIGRLQDGISLERAAASGTLIHQRFVSDKAAAIGGSSPQVERERKQVISLLAATTGYAPDRGRYARPLMIVSGITALVLLVACANFTNLMLVQSERRRREFVMRLALGAGRWRLIRQSATECVVLALVAGFLGLLFARWASAMALNQFAVMIMPVEFELEFDARVLGFASACVAVAIAFGLWPCTRPARLAVLSAVQQSTHGIGRTRGRASTARIMLTGQLAICTVLLVGAGLLLRTVINLRSQDLGYDRNVLLVSVSPGDGGYAGDAAEMLIQRIRERLLAVRGIQAVGLSGPALLDPTNYWVDASQRLITDRGLVASGARWTSASVGPGFFQAVGMAVVEGRGFDDGDARPGAAGIVINRSLATFLFGNETAIGRQIRMSPRAPMQSVIGVINDAKQVSPRDHGMGVVYEPLRGFNHVVLAVRTAGPPADAAPVVRHQIGSIAGNLPIEHVRTISDVLDKAIAQERLMSVIALFLGALVIAIGCVGLYALMSYEVVQRTRELGIRLALGATKKKLATLVLRDSAALVVPGLAIGVPLGIAACRPLAPQLYGVESADPWTLACVALVLSVVTVIATVRPAQAAARIDPIDLLRNE